MVGGLGFAAGGVTAGGVIVSARACCTGAIRPTALNAATMILTFIFIFTSPDKDGQRLGFATRCRLEITGESSSLRARRDACPDALFDCNPPLATKIILARHFPRC